ncbi:hypothetical protein QAD02_018259 [Eretmocerus hayati]|uniref:Uncharacterized protein n=1 Tax=Eretmocerus hayati TaxID=131215 RepID=A0ACC2PJA0_9HYME|nr:hypothetical protein QAD02_018259 [Eretmocerus hayati]
MTRDFRRGRYKPCFQARHPLDTIIFLLSILSFPLPFIEAQAPECPPSESIPGCPCYNFEDGLFLECAGATEDTLKSTLLTVTSSAEEDVLVQSLSIYELDKTVEELKESAFPPGVQIRHLQISHSSLTGISEGAFKSLKTNLESLGVISGRLGQVPQKALTELSKLAALDLEANLIQDLSSYCFYGLKLMKLTLKGNQISTVSEYAFAGLEASLSELDLTENRLRQFPMPALRRLEALDSLRLAWNEISDLPDDGHSLINSLQVLDLSSNNFEKLGEDCFRPFPILQTLSLYFNSIEDVDKNALVSLRLLESIDLSHNKIVFLDAATFKANERLRIIELSHNHIHYIGGVFAGLPELRELYLAENNVLELPGDAFAGSSRLTVLYLQQNAIHRLDARGLAGLGELEQLHLSSNYLEKFAPDLLYGCPRLASLSLDGNKLHELQSGSFTGLTRLRELRLQGNQIIELQRGVFAGLAALQELHLQDNAIKNVESGALGSLVALQHVNLQRNELTDLVEAFDDSNEAGASVKVLWLGHNRLVRLRASLLSHLPLVERLYLTNNSISSIEDGAFRAMGRVLTYLELSANLLSEVTRGTFAELGELEELYLRDNGLRSLEPGAFAALRRLRLLDLANNRLGLLRAGVFGGNEASSLPLKQLDLKNCSLRTIESTAFEGLNELVELSLDDNELSAAALRSLRISGLQILTASRNNFSQLAEHSFNGLPSLQQLVLDDVGLTHLPANLFALNVNLAKLQLGKNQLRDLPPGIFDNLVALKELRLNDNRIVQLPSSALAGTKNIEILSLSRNQIGTVDMASFAELKNLRELDLRHNAIESMAGFASANLSRLLSVDLGHNNLHTLPGNFFAHSSTLRRVDLSENKFKQIPSTALSSLNLPGLTWLNLTRNPFTKIHQQPPESRYPLLQELDLSNTNLTILTSQDFEAFPALQHLFLSHNSISRVSPGVFRSLPNLLTLNLGMNGISILPQERLQGLEHLRILNLTHNRLKDLEEFPKDLKALQILDLSYNEIVTVGKATFKNLLNLVELHLYGNWINTISSEAFRPLKKLRLLDLSRNYLENLPLNAFRPLETQIRSLRAEENPLNCGCESQELWEWLRDHQKLVGGANRGHGKSGSGMDEVESGLLRCEQPPELRGLVFLDLDPNAFCSTPLVLKLAIQDIQPYSVLVSWQSRNHSGLHGYQVAYHSLGNVDEVRGKLLEPKARSVRLTRLKPDTRYLICVLGLGSWSGPIPGLGIPTVSSSWNSSTNGGVGELLDGASQNVMVNSAMSRCAEVRTLEANGASDGGANAGLDGELNSPGGAGIILLGADGLAERTNLASLLTRRLGLIVGCCMGFVVFVLLVSVLGYLKMKKQRAVAKREQQQLQQSGGTSMGGGLGSPPEYLSYRHFSLPGAASLVGPDAPPSFIGGPNGS